MQFDRHAGRDAERRKFLNPAEVPRADISHTRLLADVQPVHGSHHGIDLIVHLSATISFGNRMLMRAEARMPQQSANRIGYAARQQMLKLAGVGFAFFNRHSQHVHNQTFGQPMTADDFFGGLPSLLGQFQLPSAGTRDVARALAFGQQLFADFGHSRFRNLGFRRQTAFFARPGGFQDFDNLFGNSLVHKVVGGW